MPVNSYNLKPETLKGALPEAVGDVIFVDSGNGNSSADGSSQRPFDTLDNAISKAGVSDVDTIVLMPGHNESLTAATSAVLDVAGVRVVGLGQGNLRPTFDFDNTAATFEIDAANISVENVVFNASVSAVVVGVNVDAAGVTLKGCKWTYEATGDDFVTMIDVDGVNDCSIIDCEFIAEDTAGCDEAIRLDDADNVVIAGCNIYGDFTDGAIIGEGAVGTNLVIRDNTIYNSDTTAGYVIDLNVAFTGLIAHNSCGTLFATAPETAFDPGSCLCIENYVCNAVDESGALVPTTVST